MKLYVWDRQRQLWRPAYHAGLLFKSQEMCLQHMRDCDSALGNAKVSTADLENKDQYLEVLCSHA